MLLDPQGHYRAFTRSLPGTAGLCSMHCTITDKKREIRPEENLLLLKLTWSSFMSVPNWLMARQV